MPVSGITSAWGILQRMLRKMPFRFRKEQFLPAFYPTFFPFFSSQANGLRAQNPCTSFLLSKSIIYQQIMKCSYLRWIMDMASISQNINGFIVTLAICNWWVTTLTSRTNRKIAKISLSRTYNLIARQSWLTRSVVCTLYLRYATRPFCTVPFYWRTGAASNFFIGHSTVV